MACLEKLALNWVDMYGYIHALSLVGLSQLKYYGIVSSFIFFNIYMQDLFGMPCREAVYICLNPAFRGRVSMQPTPLDVICSPCPIHAIYCDRFHTTAFLQNLFPRA